MFHKEPKNVNDLSKIRKFGDKKQFFISHSGKIYNLLDVHYNLRIKYTVYHLDIDTSHALDSESKCCRWIMGLKTCKMSHQIPLDGEIN